MTQNSIETFHKTTELRQTNKQKVLLALKVENNQSRFEIGRRTGLDDIEVQRRLSDLYNEDKAVITGSRKHFECDVSLYSIKQQLELYPKEKKPTFLQWAKQNRPEWITEFKLLGRHEL